MRRRRGGVRSQRPHHHRRRPTLTFSMSATSRAARGVGVGRREKHCAISLCAAQTGEREGERMFCRGAAPRGAICGEHGRPRGPPSLHRRAKTTMGGTDKIGKSRHRTFPPKLGFGHHCADPLSSTCERVTHVQNEFAQRTTVTHASEWDVCMQIFHPLECNRRGCHLARSG